MMILVLYSFLGTIIEIEPVEIESYNSVASGRLPESPSAFNISGSNKPSYTFHGRCTFD